MKGSEKMAVYVGTFVFVIIGYILMQFVYDVLWDVFTELGIDFLTPIRVGSLVYGLGWFVLGFLVYWGATRWLESGEKIGMLSLFFIVIWLISTFGILIGHLLYLMIEGTNIVLQIDSLLDTYFSVLNLALIPSLAATLGVSNKST
ncbi:MAG: hypothetical protein ACFFAJ_04395 [Candidatus Hodarchaeota archaeon]